MTNNQIYIVSKNAMNKWQVKKEGATKALRVFDIKEDAVRYAKEVSSNQKTTYLVEEKKQVSIDNIMQKAEDKQEPRSKKVNKRKSRLLWKPILIVLCGIGIGIVAGIIAFDIYFNGAYFKLIGEESITIHLNETYIDEGFVATYNQKDISDFVEVSYKKTSGEEVVEIDTSISCSYLIVYHLNYQEKQMNASLIRIVSVDMKNIVTADNLSIHFLELGNKYTGDSIYIKAGDSDILIDAGSRKNSALAITNYVNQFCTDGKLEYVIATHGHQDHIAGFVGASKAPGIFDSFECDIIIDYPKTNATSAINNDYQRLVSKEVQEGATHYSALECYYEINGASRIYELAEGITMSILYNYYYEHDTNDENDYSVCVLITEGDNNYLFTGDLEEDGEKRLVQNNELPEVEVYKAGHHGSKTSSSLELLNVIKPKIICVCCCAGSTEYTTNNNNTFPTQDFISRIKNYTDKIYVTSIDSSNELGYESFNGCIVVTSINGTINVNCSNNNIILKDTEWFKRNRKWE